MLLIQQIGTVTPYEGMAFFCGKTPAQETGKRSVFKSIKVYENKIQ